jgi:hypothetical protein
MSQNFSNIYETSFDSQAHLAYERRGMRLPGTVRMATQVIGKEHEFPVYGNAAEAAAKAQYEEYSTTGKGGTKAFVTAALTTNHWHDWVDEDDMTSSTVDDVANTAMEAITKTGQKTDNKIVTALEAATTTLPVAAAGLTKAKCLKAIETLNGNNVPMDDRFALVDAQQWTDLLGITEFASQDYIGADDLPWLTSANARVWLGVTWILFPGLPLATADRSCFMYHRSAVGYANSIPLKTGVTFIDDRDAWLIKAKARDGAVILDNKGIVEIVCLES